MGLQGSKSSKEVSTQNKTSVNFTNRKSEPSTTKKTASPKDNAHIVPRSRSGNNRLKGVCPAIRRSLPHTSASNQRCVATTNEGPCEIERVTTQSGGNQTLPFAGGLSEGTILRDKFVKENAAVLTNAYEIDSKKLGAGTYGSVARGVNVVTGQVRAVKTIPKNSVKSVERFKVEISIMKSLDHPNIVKLFETFEDHRSIYLCMELCSGGELFDRIIEVGHFTEKDAAIFMKQIFSGVHYLHCNMVMHRDLKPENFLFLDKNDSTLKIIDFGLSCRFKPGERCSTKAGTPYYVAPQVLSGSYDKSCDNWSCGVIMYVLLCGYPPFYGETDQEVLAKVRSGQFNFHGPGWRQVSQDARDLISKLLKFHSKERYTAEEALQHSWLRNLAKLSPSVLLPATLMANLRGFRGQNKLKKAVLTVIAQHLTEKEILNLKQIFFSLDTDHSGTLSLQEMTEGLKRLGWVEIPADLQQIMHDVDSDGSGYIDYTEFIAATMDKKLYLRKDLLWAAFRVFDLDGDGKISLEELQHVVGDPTLQDAFGSDTLRRLMADADLDGNGEIDFDEFTEMMRRRPNTSESHEPPSHCPQSAVESTTTATHRSFTRIRHAHTTSSPGSSSPGLVSKFRFPSRWTRLPVKEDSLVSREQKEVVTSPRSKHPRKTGKPTNQPVKGAKTSDYAQRG